MADFKVRDFRNKGWFIVDDAYLNGYAKLVRPHTTLVYLSLCRHADKEQKAFPSIKRIAEEFGISRTSVKESIKELIAFKMTKRVRLGKRLNNEYWLLDKSEWVMDGRRPSQNINDGRLTTEVKGVRRPNDGREATHKDTQGKETHKKDKSSFNKIPVNGFNEKIKNREEYRCWEIARDLGEENMNFLLAVLREHGLGVIESAYGELRETLRRKSLRGNKRAYFNKIIQNKVKERLRSENSLSPDAY